MLVRMRSGNVENLFDHIARQYIRLGRATELTPQSEAILHAEEQGGPAACTGVELAIHELKSETAALTYVRTPRSRG